MEEEKKVETSEEPIEVLGNTGIIEPVTEPAPEPASEPVVETPVETPAEPAPVEPVAEPVVEETPAAEPVVETPAEPAPEAAPAEVPAESAPATEETPAPAEPVTVPVEEKKEETKKKSSPVLIIIMIIVLILGGAYAIWYFVLGGNGSKEEPKKEEPKQQENENGKKEEAKPVALTEEDIKEYDLLMATMLMYQENKQGLKVEDLNNQQILDVGLMDIEGSDSSFTKDALKASIEKKLGKVTYTDESIICAMDNLPIYVYDAENGTYTYDGASHGHGGKGSPYKYQYFQNAEKDETKGIITISYKYLYGNNPGDAGAPEATFYKTVKDANEKQNILFEDSTIEPEKVKEAADKTYEEKKAELPTTTFTFKKDDNGNYVFQEVITK